MRSAVSLIVPVYLWLCVMSWKWAMNPEGSCMVVYFVVCERVDKAEAQMFSGPFKIWRELTLAPNWERGC
jgi:hypothetical protein